MDGMGTGGFVIVDGEGHEVVRVGKFFGPAHTNNEAEALALAEALLCLSSLRRSHAALRLPVRVWGDS